MSCTYEHKVRNLIKSGMLEEELRKFGIECGSDIFGNMSIPYYTLLGVMLDVLERLNRLENRSNE